MSSQPDHAPAATSNAPASSTPRTSSTTSTRSTSTAKKASPAPSALYRAILPDLEIRVLDQTTDGNRVTSRWTLHGTHKGRAVTLPGITISRFEHGKIAEDWTVSDNLELLRRLGVRRALALAARQLSGRLLGSQ
jgi:hypothetical protein